MDSAGDLWGVLDAGKAVLDGGASALAGVGDHRRGGALALSADAGGAVLPGGASPRGDYILHCVDSLVYPNLPYWVVAACGVVVCGVNLGVYAWRGWVWLQRRKAAWRC